MKISAQMALGLAAIAALSSSTLAQTDCIEGSELCDLGDPIGPFIDGDPNRPQDPSDPATPLLRWSSFENVTADIERTTINHFGDTVIVRRFGQTSAWGTLAAPDYDTFDPDARLPGVESTDFNTLAARGNTPTDNYAIMLKFESGFMSHDDVLTIGQLYRDNANALTSARIVASYQGVGVDLSNFEIFNMDLTVDGLGLVFEPDLMLDQSTGAFIPTANGANSDYAMLRPLDGVLVDKIDIFFDSTRPSSPYPDRIDIGLGSFVVPSPGPASLLGLGLLAGTRRRR